MYILYFLSGAGFALGLFLILCDVLKVPSVKASATMRGIEQHYNTKETKINSSLGLVAIWISKMLRLRDFKRAQLQSDLHTAHMDITPEMFIANCIVKAGVVALLGVLLLPIIPAVAIIAFIVAVIYYFQLTQDLAKKVRAHRSAVEFELVQMIATISRVLRHNRNIIKMLEDFREIAGEDMKAELDITLADMNSGNYEQAISRMEIRVGSVMMSDVCRGLISIMHGDDTTAYWISLHQKFSEHQRDLLKHRAERIPAKVNRLSMVLLFAFMALWLVLLILQMADSMGGLFGTM